jgi:hypothetical protein
MPSALAVFILMVSSAVVARKLFAAAILRADGDENWERLSSATPRLSLFGYARLTCSHQIREGPDMTAGPSFAILRGVSQTSGAKIMLDAPSVAIDQHSLFNERAVDWLQPHVPPPALAATMNLSRRSFLMAGACASSVLWPKVARAQGGIWQEYRRDDAGFRIEMPGAPKIRVEKGNPGDNWTTSTNAQVRYQHEIFDVSWTEFKDFVSVEDEYRRFRELMTGAGYRIEEDIPLTLNDVPAREFIIETGNINFVRRIMAVRSLAIAIHVTGARNIRYSPTVRRFLDSFKLLRT